jgi:glucokinase
MQDDGDPAPVIAEHALDRRDEACVRAMELFTTAFGAQAGNLALTVLSSGGVYLAGGIAPQIIPALRWGHFVNALRDKGRLSDFTTRVPVHVITNPDVAIYGAAAVAAHD